MVQLGFDKTIRSFNVLAKNRPPNDLRELAAFNRDNNRKYSLYIVNYIYFTGLWE